MINPSNNLKRVLSIGIVFLFFAADISYAAAVRVPMNITGRPKATLDLERSIEILVPWLEICRKDDISGAIRFFPDRAMVISLNGIPQPIIVPDGPIGEAAKLFWGSVLSTRGNPSVTVPVSINIEDDIRRVLKEEAGLQKRAGVRRRSLVRHDYGSSGTFTQVSRNRLFGLTVIPAEKRSLAQSLGLRRTKESLDVQDLNAGLLNRPGARYYLWTGRNLKYFVAKNVRRTAFMKEAADWDAEPNRYNLEVEIIREFLSATQVKFPFYVFAYIPGVLSEDAEFFDIDGKKTHATRLGNMPVLTLGYLVNEPHGVTLAKMLHEKIAFRAKQEGGSRLGQHIAGLIAEHDLLVDYYVKVDGQISKARAKKADNKDRLELVRLNIKKETILRAIDEARAFLKKAIRQSRGARGYLDNRLSIAHDYADTGAGFVTGAGTEKNEIVEVGIPGTSWVVKLNRGQGEKLTTVDFIDRSANRSISTYTIFSSEQSLQGIAERISAYFSSNSIKEKDFVKALNIVPDLSRPVSAFSSLIAIDTAL